MIKYLEYDSFDEYGQHIIPVNSLYHMNKMASGTYSPELMKIILNMKRRQDRYYVVVNALGSHEVYGCNRNGDSFPESGLSHKSLRTDMGTINDYGYKTFEYYAKLYKHHINKDPKNSYGEIIFSHWNPIIHRVELIIAIDSEKAKDIIDAVESNDPVSVSMGCFINPEFPILTIEGYKPIKDIKIGDLVFTHNGNWKQVTQTHRRKYTGKIYKVWMRGLSLPLELTADHPMMMKCFQKISKNKQRPYYNSNEFDNKKFDWAHIEHVEIGDHIQYLPVKYNPCEFAAINDEKLAKLMGYYFAEGSFIYNNGKPSTIQLSCHLDDDLPREVPKLINELFPNTTCSVNTHHNSDKGLVVNINSTQLACFMNKYMSHLAHNKVIPPEIFVAETNIKLSFLGAWLSGDGFCDKKGVHWSSCNLNALLQARDLLISCGIASSLYRIIHKAGAGFNTHETIEYTLNISHLDAEPLIPYCNRKLSNLSKIIDLKVRQGLTSIKINSDGTYSYPVNEIECYHAENIQTYNFEVEDDESYIAAGLVSHNCKVKYDRCSICDNKAPTRAKYCKHLIDYMREIVTEDLARKWSIETGRNIIPGMQVFAFNDYPRFFDLSRVYIGADRTSYILGKAASKGHIIFSTDIAESEGVTDAMVDKMAAVGKLGEIEKELGGAVSPQDVDGPAEKSDGIMVKSDEMEAIKKSLDEKINNTIALEPRIPNDMLDAMSSSLPLNTIFSTLFGLGIHPKPAEFQRIILIKINQKPLADELDKANIVFNHNDESVEPESVDISPSDFSDTLGKALMPFMSERSCFPSMLGPRMRIIMVKTAQFTDINKGNVEPKIDPALTALAGLAALYAGMKLKAMGYGPKDLASLVTKPWIMPLIGGSIMWKIYDEINKREAEDQALLSGTDYKNILQNTNLSGHLKVASQFDYKGAADKIGKGLLTSALILPSAYIANAWNKKSLYETGKPAFPGAGINPLTASVLGGAGTIGAQYLHQGVKNVIKKELLKIKK